MFEVTSERVANSDERFAVIFDIKSRNNSSEEEREVFVKKVLSSVDYNQVVCDHRKTMPTYIVVGAVQSKIIGVSWIE